MKDRAPLPLLRIPAGQVQPGDRLHLPGLVVTVQLMRIRRGRAVVLCVGDSFPTRSWPCGFVLSVQRTAPQ